MTLTDRVTALEVQVAGLLAGVTPPPAPAPAPAVAPDPPAPPEAPAPLVDVPAAVEPLVDSGA